MSHVQDAQQGGIPMPQELLRNLMLEKILSGLPGPNLQVEHNLEAAEVALLEVPIHKESLSLQELLPIPQINLLCP